MHQNNTELVLMTIWKAGEMSRVQVAEATGMSIVTVGRIADELMARGVLREQERGGGTQVGRPPKLLSLEKDDLFCASVFLDRDCLYLGMVDPCGKISCQESHPLPEGEFVPKVILPWMAERIAAFMEAHEPQREHAVVGVVMPGVIDFQRGVLEYSANFHWRDVAVVDYMKERMPQYEFILENDTKAMALAEHSFGASADCQNMVVLSIGDGIGAAVIIDGEIYRGQKNMAGEIGHISLNPAGKICECGKVGCLQTHLSQRSILAEAQMVYPGITMEELFDRVRQEDPFSVALIGQVVVYTSIAINILVNTYAPEVVLICGSMLRQDPLFAQMVEQNYREQIIKYMQDSVELRFETFGVSGHLIGGGVLALHRTLSELCQ